MESNEPKKIGNPNWGKGIVTNPNGRPKGANNKVTTEIKEAYINLIQGNLGSIQNWLDRVAVKDPGKAIELLLKISPFVIPKLTEETNPMPINIVLPKGVTKNDITDTENND